MTFESSALVGAWLAIALLGLALSGIMRQVSMLSRQSSPVRRPGIGPVMGSEVPAHSRLARIVQPGSPMLVVFADATCATCRQLFDAAERSAWTEPLGDVPVVVVATDAAPPGAGDVATSVVVDDQALLEEWRVVATPLAVVLDRTGRVAASAPVGTPGRLREVVMIHLPVATSTVSGEPGQLQPNDLSRTTSQELS